MNAVVNSKIAQRAIYITMHPNPNSFAERREVFRVIQGFGELEMFRSIKYLNSDRDTSFVAVFRQTSSAAQLLEAAPLRYTLSPVENPTSPSSNKSEPGETSEDKSGDSSREQRHFQLDCERSIRMSAKSAFATAENRYSGQWRPIEARDSAFGTSLLELLPPSLATRGLVDWETESMKSSLLNKNLVTATPQRIVKKMVKQNSVLAELSPKQIWDRRRKQ
ncbi:hypothetical protein PVAG01_04709 [Phlyctema vagabunda]|uniref:Uncharacterized protein n=1 Tax=Phlyctema vagabunda TaxID=108571 RepID=A0ABR4PIN8_9HELO